MPAQTDTGKGRDMVKVCFAAATTVQTVVKKTFEQDTMLTTLNEIFGSLLRLVMNLQYQNQIE